MTAPTMSNQRSVMTEFRFLDQKRQAEGLTAEEASRYAQLRDLVGPEAAGPPRSGFDVNAAAARLRESLLPAGLRNRPAEAPPPPAPEPPPLEIPAEAPPPEQAWAEAPFAEAAPEPADPLFDPGSLAQEVKPQAWNPEAPGYDPNAPYDEAAWIAAGYDPSATYDWSAYGYGPDGQPLATDAAAAPPAEAPPEQPLELAGPPTVDAGWDLGAAEAAPGAWGAEASTPAVPAAAEAIPEGWDGAFAEPAAAPPEVGVEQDWAAPAVGPEAGPIDAELAPALEAEAELVPAAEAEALPFDPNAPFDHAKWFGHADVPAATPAATPALEPAPEPGPTFDLAAAPEPTAPATPAFGEYDEVAAPPAMGAQPDLLQGAEPALEASPPLDVGLEAPEAGAAPAEAADSAGWLGDAPFDAYQPAPAGAPFGEYDEAAAPLAGAPDADQGLEAMLPFDPAAASAIEPGAMPEGYEPSGPTLDPASLPPVQPGGYDDAAAFADSASGGPEGDALPGGAPLELGEVLPDWQPDTALEQGFELASDGSFGHPEPPASHTPAWGSPAAAAPAEGWESAPALDLAAPFEAPVHPSAQPLEAAERGAEELPTIDGAELLEELPPEAISPLPASGATEGGLETEAGRSALDGAFEDVAAVEAAAYPPPDLADAFTAAGAEASSLEPPAPGAPPAWEPEPAVSYEAAPAGLPPEIAAAYAEGTPGVAAPEPEPLEAEPLPSPVPSVVVEGTHRVVLHTVDGLVKRGLLVDAALDEPALPLHPQGFGTPELVPTEAIKAIFFMLSPGEKAPAPEGKKVRVTFRDGRQVAGFSPGYQEGLVGFFMIPADTRTNTGRIWVYQSAVKAVAVS